VNKKLVLSVLSTAVVASMASSAFAAPKAGLYFNQSAKFYNLTDILKLNTSAYGEFKNQLTTSDRNQIVFVKANGKGASVQEILTEKDAWDEPLVQSDFATSYSEIGTDGSVVGTYKPEVEPPVTGDLKVESVSAINLKQIEVKFTTELNESSVVIGNFELGTQSDVTAAFGAGWTASLKADKKTVVLNYSGATPLTAEKVYFIKTVAGGLKAANGTEVTVETKQFTTPKADADVTAPVVTGTAFDTAGNLEITFSEPIAAAPAVVRVNNVDVTGATLVKVDDTKYEITAAGLTAAGVKANVASTIYIAGAKDDAGNDLTAYNGTFTKVTDTTKPAVKEIKQLTDTTFAVYFTEALAAGATDFATGDLTAINTAGVTSTPAVGAATTDAAGATYYPVTLPAYAAGQSSQTLTLVFAQDSVKDAAANGNEAYTTTKTFTKDASAPTFVSTKLVNDVNGKPTKVEVAFNEALSAETDALVQVLKDGVLQSNIVTTIKGTDNKVVELDFGTGANLPAGTFTIVFKAGAVLDNAGTPNPNAEFTTTVTVPGTTVAPTIDVTASQTLSSTANQFKVKFAQGVNNASALNLANYKLDGVALDSTKAQNPYIQIDVDNNPIVVIELKDGWNNIGNAPAGSNAVLTVSGVKDSNNVTIADTNITVKRADNKAATLVSATKVAPNVLKLTFDESLSATFADITDILDDVVISDGTNTFAATAVAPGTNAATATGTISGMDLIITVDPQDSNWATVTGASKVTVKTVNTGDGDIKDANGLEVKADVSVNLQ